MSFGGMAATCIFCEQKATTREHAIPRWVARRFDLKGKFMAEIEAINAPEPRQHVSIASHRAFILCEECQAHFALLEDRVCDVLTAMGNGVPLVLGDADQAALARWGAKTAYALIAAERDEQGRRRTEETPRAHRLAVRNGLPPKHVYVAYAAYADPGARMILGTPHLDDPAVNRARRTYNAVLAFGQVLLKVMSFFEPEERDRFGFPVRDGNPVFAQVWPPRQPKIMWPPSIAISGDEGFLFVPVLED